MKKPTAKMTTTETVTIEQIAALRAEAAAAGDQRMVRTCDIARHGMYDPSRGAKAAPASDCDEEIEACVRAINAAEAME